jgi:hypothetical protein
MDFEFLELGQSPNAMDSARWGVSVNFDTGISNEGARSFATGRRKPKKRPTRHDAQGAEEVCGP